MLGGASTETRDPGLARRWACRRTPCARESCNSDSSPEPSAACSERGVLGGASTEPRDPGLVGRVLAGALCARERAVILTAVQSLRLLGRRGRLLVGWREYGASRSRACWEGAGRRTSCERESCDAHSSPEPSAAWSERAIACWERGEYGASRFRACWERANPVRGCGNF